MMKLTVTYCHLPVSSQTKASWWTCVSVQQSLFEPRWWRARCVAPSAVDWQAGPRRQQRLIYFRIQTCQWTQTVLYLSSDLKDCYLGHFKYKHLIRNDPPAVATWRCSGVGRRDSYILDDVMAGCVAGIPLTTSDSRPMGNQELDSNRILHWDPQCLAGHLHLVAEGALTPWIVCTTAGDSPNLYKCSGSVASPTAVGLQYFWEVEDRAPDSAGTKTYGKLVKASTVDVVHSLMRQTDLSSPSWPSPITPEWVWDKTSDSVKIVTSQLVAFSCAVWNGCLFITAHGKVVSRVLAMVLETPDSVSTQWVWSRSYWE